MRGTIIVSWNISLARDRVQLAVTLPIGVRRATVIIPTPFYANGTQAAPGSCAVTESGKVIWKDAAVTAGVLPEGILSVRKGNGTAARPEGVVQVELAGNGRYAFESSMLPGPQLLEQ